MPQRRVRDVPAPEECDAASRRSRCPAGCSGHGRERRRPRRGPHKTGEPYVRVDTDADASAARRKLALARRRRGVRSEVVSWPSGEPEALGDAFPMLRARLDPTQQGASPSALRRHAGRPVHRERTVGEARTLSSRPSSSTTEATRRRAAASLLGRSSDSTLGADIDAILRNLAG